MTVAKAERNSAMSHALALESHEVGGQPLIQPFLDQLDLRRFIEQALGEPDHRLM